MADKQVEAPTEETNMDEAKHTPGPWFYQASDNSVRTGDRMPIASDIFGECREIYQANAQLIAAAPELLKALETFMEILKDIKLPTAVEGYARAAIAKAKGQ